jgi:AhpD family alkylhydroperoxidase
MEPGFHKRIFTPASFRAALNDLTEHLDDMRAARRAGRVDRAFAERVMLAVTQVNGCRYCNYAHSRMALRARVSPEEIASLQAGAFGEAPLAQLVALTFAQHYAESQGHPEPETWQRLVNAYGPDAARDIMAHIRMITLANLLGNTVDALLSRLRSQPAPGSSLGQELGGLLSALFLTPVALLRRKQPGVVIPT